MKKIFLILLLFTLLVIPISYAEEDEEDSSWISNLATSLLEKIGSAISKTILL